MKTILLIFAFIPLSVTSLPADEQALDRLSNMFLGFLAVADIKQENALLGDDEDTPDENENDKAARRNNQRRRRNNERRRNDDKRNNNEDPIRGARRNMQRSRRDYSQDDVME